ncbi:MAG: cation transporter [Proteobacteria bacterium]|nr:cation transporter [Pseudomonadota bacterium]
MKHWLFALALAAMLLAGAPGAAAGERTVTLRVPMYCATCPYIVQRTLERVAGVVAVTTSYREQSAVVTFDDDRVDVAALTAATAGIGFPSELVESD